MISLVKLYYMSSIASSHFFSLLFSVLVCLFARDTSRRGTTSRSSKRTPRDAAACTDSTAAIRSIALIFFFLLSCHLPQISVDAGQHAAPRSGSPEAACTQSTAVRDPTFSKDLGLLEADANDNANASSGDAGATLDAENGRWV